MPGGDEVKYITHSPPGALITLGSCENAGKTTERREKVAPSLEVSWTMRELLVHESIPQCSIISLAHMWYVPVSASSSTAPPHELVLTPPSVRR